MDCIFCKIIAGEIPSSKVYEDDKVYAFLDIAPITPGHTLVIPKRHSTNLYDVPAEDLHATADACQRMAKALKAGLGCDGVNLGMNNEKAAGQLVPHTHFHLIPRREGDGLTHWPGGKYAPGEEQALIEKITQALTNYIERNK